MPPPRDLDRAATVLAMLTGFAERGEVVPPMAELGARLGVAGRVMRWEMISHERAGAFTVEREGAGMAQQIRIVLPTGAASRWSPTWAPKGDGRTGTRRVLALLTDVARRGAPAPSNRDMAGALRITPALVHSALNNLIAAGRIVAHRTGTARDGMRQFEIDGHRTAWARRSSDPAPRTTPRAAPNIVGGGEPKRPDQPISARRLPRCPFCELPAGHHLCGHGWNGITTRAGRLAIAAAAGLSTTRKGAAA